MPEGPELLYFATLLKKKFNNSIISDILSFTNKPVIIPKDYEGKIININSKGKILWIQVTGKNHDYFIHIHYGISGWLTTEKPEKNIKFEFIIKKKSREIRLYMEDQRRFSKIKIYKEEDHIKALNLLGIDIFSKEFTLIKFKEEIENKNTLLAPFLLNQNIFSGIGNYIKNESLYLTRLHIKIKTSELDDDKIKILYNNILFVAYSNLYEMLKDSEIEKYLDDNKKYNKPSKLEVPYKYKIYSLDKTITGEKVYKVKVGGRDSYCIKELCK